MSDAWKDRQRAAEASYFEKQEQEALRRLKEGQHPKRPSPITGEPMEQVVIDGVTIDRCPKSGGIWLDAGELETILSNNLAVKDKSSSWLGDFLTKLTKP